jgi:hypothetical protein
MAGVNNHYLTFGSAVEVTRVLDDAVAIGANVVRTILQPVIGSILGPALTAISPSLSFQYSRYERSFHAEVA